MEILYIVIGAAIIWLLQKVLYQKYWKKNLSVAIAFAQHEITEQEEGGLCETISNQKWLPLPVLRVKFEADRHLDFLQEENIAVTDRCYKSDIFSVMAYQKIIRKLKFVGKRRGYYAIEKVSVDSTDLFMEKHLRAEIACHTWLYVFPRQADIRRLMIPYQKIMGDILTRRYTYEDPFEFQGIRSYEPYDRMRDINWKATARTGELCTNLHGYTVRQEVCLLLNLELESMMEYAQLREESIRITNSLAQMLIAQGIPVGIYSNAKDLLSKKELRLMPGANLHHLKRIRENLARLDLSQPMEAFELLIKQNLINRTDRVLYVLISTSQRTKLSQAFSWLLAGASGSLWILPLHPWMEQKAILPKGCSVIRWDVEQDA